VYNNSDRQREKKRTRELIREQEKEMAQDVSIFINIISCIFGSI
jgi:hypothetical protein